MTRTRHKLDEAAFFLGKLEEHQYDFLEKLEEYDDFQALRVATVSTYGFYLSAFVSAGRSVTWVMRSEYSGRPDWDQWYQEQKPSRDEDDLLAAFTRLRNRSQKAEPISPIYQLRVGAGDLGPPLDRDPKLPRVKVTLTPVDGGKAIGGEVMAFSWSVPELEGDLLMACREYFQSLERLVDSCEKAYGATAQQ